MSDTCFQPIAFGSRSEVARRSISRLPKRKVNGALTIRRGGRTAPAEVREEKLEVQFNIIGDYAQILRERLRIRGYEECLVDIIKDDYNLVLAYFGALRRMVSMVKRTVF